MARIRKYRPGAVLASMQEVITAIALGRWVFLRDKPLNPSVLDNMNLCTVRGFLRRGMLRWADFNT
jgi:hypothetical protein